jgi:hypothetical protein
MKNANVFLLPVLAVTAFAAEQAPSTAVNSTPPPVRSGEWERKQLSNHFWSEGACAADVNKDGNTDILSGPFWYAGPDFTKRHTIYQMEKSFAVKKPDGTEEKVPGFKGLLSGVNEYYNNFISYAHDFNKDGWDDYLVIGFPGQETFWFENPQGKDELWQRHTVLKVTDNESPMFMDVDGDKVPDLLAMSGGAVGYAKMDPANPKAEWKWHNVSGPADKRFQRFTHGIGAGDVNGDGQIDILESQGWWQRPVNWDGTTPWKFNQTHFGAGGAQMFVYDVNGDGKNDVITSLAAHGWGVVWFEQTNDGGVVGWNKHVIVGANAKEAATGVAFSQPHAIDIADMNGDGLMDVITGKRFWAHGPKGDAEPNAWPVVWWFELKREGGKASFVPHLVDEESGVGTQVMATDVNGDKKLDVVVGNKRGVFVHIRK